MKETLSTLGIIIFGLAMLPLWPIIVTGIFIALVYGAGHIHGSNKSRKHSLDIKK